MNAEHLAPTSTGLGLGLGLGLGFLTPGPHFHSVSVCLCSRKMKVDLAPSCAASWMGMHDAILGRWMAGMG